MIHHAYLISQARALRKTMRQSFGPKSLRTAAEAFDCQFEIPEICVTVAPYFVWEDEFAVPVKACGPWRDRLHQLKGRSHWEYEDRMRTGALKTFIALIKSGRLKLVQARGTTSEGES